MVSRSVSKPNDVFDAKVESYDAHPYGGDAMNPWESIGSSDGNPEDVLFAEPKPENPHVSLVRQVIEEKCTEAQQDFFHNHFGMQKQMEEIRQEEAIMLTHICCVSVAFASSEVEMLKQQGESFFEKMDYDKAIESYKKAAKLEKNNAELNNKIGLGYFKKQEYKTAIKYFNRAIKADINFKEARDNIKNSVTAGHLRWIDKQYDFSKVHSIFLVPMDISKAHAEDTFDMVLKQKIKCNIIKPNKRDEVSSVKGDIYIKTDIKTWDTDKYRVPERVYYDGWEDRPRRIKDKNGNWTYKNEKQYKTSSTPFFGSQKHTVPAHNVYHSNVDVLFEIYDSKSDTLIMAYNEKRSETGEYKHESIYKGMLDNFLSDLGKKIK